MFSFKKFLSIPRPFIGLFAFMLVLYSGQALASNSFNAPLPSYYQQDGRERIQSASPISLSSAEAFSVSSTNDKDGSVIVRFKVSPGYYLYKDKISFTFSDKQWEFDKPVWPESEKHNDENFGSVNVFRHDFSVRLPAKSSAKSVIDGNLKIIYQGCQEAGVCYPPVTTNIYLGSHQAETKTVFSDKKDEAILPAEKDSTFSVVWILLMALVGGLILNLMPCVLPILSLKVLSISQLSGSSNMARKQALSYTVGVLAGFVALGSIVIGVRHFGSNLGWGFQLQNPIILSVLALIIFSLGLSLSGVWHIGGRWTNVGGQLANRSGFAGDFFTGLLAVVVAAPCTAPFMGVSLAWAFTAPPLLSLLVFLAIGVGLALPFILIGFIPALSSWLPKPGAWMENLKQFLAFPIYLTVMWMVWVLGRQKGVDAMAIWTVSAVLVAFACWAWSKSYMGSNKWRLLAFVGLALSMGPLLGIHNLKNTPDTLATTTQGGLNIVPFSSQKLAELRSEGKTVFVNMTADWCITCKTNEKTVLGTKEFSASAQNNNVIYMVGDWTDTSAELGKFLTEYNSPGVPLYVVFDKSHSPHKLPPLLTQEIVNKAFSEVENKK